MHSSMSFFWNGQTNVLTGQVRDVIKKHFVIQISTMVEDNISLSDEQMDMFILQYLVGVGTAVSSGPC